jgi:hypothetical protein
VVEKKCAHAPALGAAKTVDAGSELDHLATDFQGANGFATSRSAGSSAGK